MSRNTIVAWMRSDPDPLDDDPEEDDEEDDREPIDQAHLEQVCNGHNYGAALLSVGSGLIARGLEICLIGTPTDSIMIGYWRQGDWEGSQPEWFTCLLRGGNFIEASVSTTSPEPYLAFFQLDVGDSLVTWFDEPVVETGGTLVRYPCSLHRI